jgi:hypothetical protein
MIAVYVYSACGGCWRFGETQPNGASAIDDQPNIVIKSFVERVEQTFRMSQSRAHAA